MRSRLVALGLVLAFSALPALADPVLLVAAFNVRPDKERLFVDLVEKYDAPMYARLMADGAVLSWGLDTTVLHDPAGPTHHIWFVCPDNAGLDKVFAAEDGVEKQIEADDAKAAQAARAAGKPAPKGTMAQLFESFDLAKHQDSLFRVLVSDGRPAGGAKPYILVTFAKVQPGKGAEFRAAWEKFIKPLTEKQVADGTLLGYGLAVASPRTDAVTHVGWITLPSLAARDKYTAAFAGRAPAEAKEAEEALTRTLQDATRGALLRSIIFEAAAPPSR